MKNKTIKKEHFDYTNELVKIIGFENLADFETVIFYDKLKCIFLYFFLMMI